MNKLELQYKIIFTTLGLISVNISFIISYMYRFEEFTFDFSAATKPDYEIILVILNLLFFVISNKKMNHIYTTHLMSVKIIKSSISDIFGIVLGYSLFILIIKGFSFSREFFLVFSLLLLVQLIVIRFLLFGLFSLHVQKQLIKKKIIIIANFEDLEVLIHNYVKDYNSIKYIFTYQNRSDHFEQLRIYYYEEFTKIVDSSDEISDAIIVFNEAKSFDPIYQHCDNIGIRTKIIPAFYKLIETQVELETNQRIPVLKVKPEPLENFWNSFIKRSFDVLTSLIVLIFFFPMILIILAVLIKIDSKGPIFFKQWRTGLNHIKFKCWKFRTMSVNEQSNGTQAIKNDPRVTKFGHILRKFNLDEFPQFINVLVGNMSVVGPRPHPIFLNEQFRNKISFYNGRHLCKPGITGWAQVNGYRGETETDMLMEKRIQYDRYYIENWTFWFDVKILFMTIFNFYKGQEKAY